jgi:hypothetical protein
MLLIFTSPYHYKDGLPEYREMFWEAVEEKRISEEGCPYITPRGAKLIRILARNY